MKQILLLLVCLWTDHLTFGQFNFPSSNDLFQGFPSSFGAQQSLTPQSSSSFQSSPFRTEFSINHSPNSIASPFSSAQSSPFLSGFSNGFPQVSGANNGFPQVPGANNGFQQVPGASDGFPQVPGVQSSNGIPSFHASNLQSLVSTIPNIPTPIQQGLRGFPGLQNFNFPATSFASPQSFSSAYNSVPQQQFTSAPSSAVSSLNNNFLSPFQPAPVSAPIQQPSTFNSPLQQGPQLTSQFSINHGLASSAASAFTNQAGISPSQRATTIQLAPPQPVQSQPPAPIQIPQQNFPTLNPQPQNIPTSNINAALQQPAPVHYASIGPKLQGDYKFGYHTGDKGSFREETRLPDGTVQGVYGYVDGDGKQRIVKYVAGVQGFQVLGDNGQPVAPQAPQAPSGQSAQPAQPAQPPRPIQPPQPIQPFNLNSQENPAFASFMGARQS